MPTGYPPPPMPSVGDLFPATPVPAHTFELALALGGTVSAGAYTAGVLDFLVEALDEWEKAKAAEDAESRRSGRTEIRVPRHNVVIRVMTGTSGGGLNAVIAGRALSYGFPHISSANTVAERERLGDQNPFYRTWVNAIDIRRFLETSDLEGRHAIPSGLCCDILDRVGKDVVSFSGGPAPRRPYLPDPLPIFLTYTNMSGIPYLQDFKTLTDRKEYFVNHADFIRFTCQLPAGLPNGELRPPDGLHVGDNAAGAIPWSKMVDYALGTAAFPIGLMPRTILRSADHYRYRYGWAESTAIGTRKAEWLTPVWASLVPEGPAAVGNYGFMSLDGGCTNNEPIELARTWLAGATGSNARNGAVANRAVILVDPFASNPGPAVLENPGLPKILFPTIDTLVEANRFQTADISLFADPNVFSRFLVTPVRSNPSDGGPVLTGGDAITGSRLGAFMGFMCREFRDHDFMLGRRNCQAFLKWTLTLPPENQVFFSPKPETLPHPSGLKSNEIPLIPLYGSATIEQAEPRWPSGVFDPEDLLSAIHYRFQTMLPLATNDLLENRFLKWLIGLFLGGVALTLAKKTVETIRKSLETKPPLK